jgi:hypothetical protein
MPINVSGNGYLATDASILVDAFEGVLKELGLVDRSDPAARLVAGHIITFAKAGERDPVRLRDLTLEAIRMAQRLSVGTRCRTRPGKNEIPKIGLGDRGPECRRRSQIRDAETQRHPTSAGIPGGFPRTSRR